MKKLICAILCMVMLLSLTVPVLADVVTYTNVELYYTDDSSFEAGGTVTIDAGKTMTDGDILSEAYNALLEGTVQYFWFRNDSFYKDGKSLVLTDADKGCSFYCLAALYSDMDRTQQFGAIKSAKFTVPNTGNPALIPEITTENIPDGTVGENYYFKLECTDADVVFDLYQSSLPDGMYITQHGEIEGIPTKAGFYHINVIATPEAGEDYAAMESFEFTIHEAGSNYTIEIIQVPNKLTYTAGEKLDMTGLKVRVYTPDGFFDSYNGDKLTYSKKALVTLGEQKIKLTYEDAMEIFIVTVVAAPATEPATEETTATTEEATEVTEVTEEATEIPTEDTTEATDDSTLTVGAIPGDGTDGTNGQNGVSEYGWVIWVIVGVCVLLMIAVAVLLVLVIVKRKKAA